MQSLAEAMRHLKVNYPQMTPERHQAIIHQIQSDPDVQDFWREQQQLLAEDALTQGLPALHEFIQQKQCLATGGKTLYPGYVPHLMVANGYPQVGYAPDHTTQRAQQQANHLTLYRVPSTLKNANLGDLTQDHGRLDAIVEVTTLLTQLTSQKIDFVPGLYLYGDFGVGKTYVMGALANALVANNIPVLLLHFPSFAVALKKTIGQPNHELEKIIEQAKTSAVVILDDVGAETLNSWLRDDILGVILEYRMQEELTTCFTSNFAMPEYESFLAQTRDGREPVKAARLMQRVKFLARPVAMSGKNRRLAKA